MLVSARFCSWIRPSMAVLRPGLRFRLPLQCLILLILLWTGHVRSNPIEDWVPAGSNWISQAPAAGPWGGEDYFRLHEDGIRLHEDGIVRKMGADDQVLWSFPPEPLASSWSTAGLGKEDRLYEQEDANSAASPYPDPEEIEIIVEENDYEVVFFSKKDQEFIAHTKAKGGDGKALATLRGKDRQLSLDEVLSRTPSRVDGAVVSGYRSSVVFVVNKTTGGLLRKFEFTPLQSKDAVSNFGNLVTGENVSTEDDSDQETLYISRTDYVFESRDLKTGSLLWGVSTARVNVLDKNVSGSDPAVVHTPVVLVTPLGTDEGARLQGRLPSASDSTYRRLALPSAGGAAPMSPHSLSLLPTAESTAPMSPHSLSLLQYLVILSVLGLICVAVYWFRHLNVRAPKRVEDKGNTNASKKKRKKTGGSKVDILGKKGEAAQKVRPPSDLQKDGGESGVGTSGGELSLSQDKVIGHGSKDGSEAGTGTWVGKLLVTDKVIGYGSNGTRVLEGYLQDGRQVAVKKMLEHNFKEASKEVATLIASDEHPNVVRYFFLERDSSFVYIALERCSCSLHDLILRARGKPGEDRERPLPEIPVRKEDLWISGDEPSEKLMWLLRNVVAGLIHLHSKNIIHRDLKPHNVLVAISGDKMKAKLCDMGISKRLDPDATSFLSHTEGGSGSRGWRAPEQLSHGEKQAPSVDLFSLGCLLFFCITGGEHPFGPHVHRESNIMRSEYDLFPMSNLPEAVHLIRSLLDKDPKTRLEAKEVLAHPFFWNPEKCLNFLLSTSDRFEHEDRVKDSVMLQDLEAVAASAFNNQWSDRIDPALLSDAVKFRQYKYRSVRDLLRLIRNRAHHYTELPLEVKALLEPYPDGYVRYFKRKFPNLLLDVYSVVKKHCKQDGFFRDFFTCPKEWLS